MEIKPEEKIEIQLWDWLINKGDHVDSVFFNRKNKINAKIFHTKGINKKPDMIIKFNRGFGNKYAVIEVKNNKKSKNVLDSGKILDVYYKNYVEGKTKYLDDEYHPIKIDHFVVASQSSPKGYIFDDEKFKYAKDNKNKSKRDVAKMKMIPKKEGEQSHQFIRDLMARQGRMNLDKKKPSIGLLISNEGIPSLFLKTYVTWLNKKNGWSQRWWTI